LFSIEAHLDLPYCQRLDGAAMAATVTRFLPLNKLFEVSKSYIPTSLEFTMIDLAGFVLLGWIVFISFFFE